jgi:predicted aspartyl protease
VKELTMGKTYARVTVTPYGSSRKYTEDFLVDTGATDSVMPASRLHEMGVEPEGSLRYELADGRKVSFQFGPMKFEVLGRVAWGKIVFGPDGSEPLLGVTILESAALKVNPVTKTLELEDSGLMKPIE